MNDLCPHCRCVTLRQIGEDENERPVMSCSNCGYPNVRPDHKDATGIDALRAAEHLMGEPITP